jgi:hypothetical protein
MSCREIVFAVASAEPSIGDVASVVSAVAGVVCAVIAAWSIRKDYKKARPSGKRGGVVSKAAELMIVVQMRSWVLLVVATMLVAFSSVDTYKLIRASANPPAPAEPNHGNSFPVMANYHPSGLMGDIGDLRPTARMQDADQFTYEPLGRGAHEWDYKYVNGMLNEKPAQFAGVMYLYPRGNWGTDPQGGHDLRDVADVLRWEARSVMGEVNVEFVIGGITWVWDEPARERIAAPYPDSLPQTSLGTKKLTTSWQAFNVDLHERGRVADNFRRTVGGFGWVITWAANGVELAEGGLTPKEKKIFTIEIRNIRYERKQR